MANNKSKKTVKPPSRYAEVPSDRAGLLAAIDRLRDAAQPVEARRETLQAIQAASFGVLDFKSIRPDYIAALRAVARDADLELRQRALGILAREHDTFAQKVLLEGLADPGKALLPEEKALQLLSYDTHAGAYPLARKILETSGHEPSRREALRLLAGDPQSAPVLERVLADKRESSELRRMSASALHALDPEKLKRWANKAVQDESEHEEIVATCLTALNHFGDAKTIAGDQKLRARVGQLQAKAPAKVKHLARQFVDKYGA